MGKACLTWLLLLAAVSAAACARQESDWKFPAAGAETRQVGGETWYDLGGGLLARRSDPADEGSSVLVMLEAPRRLPYVPPSRDARDLALSDESGERPPALMALCDEIFEKLCEKGNNPPYKTMKGSYTRGRTFFKEYLTRSGRTARVEIDLDGQTAEVSIGPPSGE